MVFPARCIIHAEGAPSWIVVSSFIDICRSNPTAAHGRNQKSGEFQSNSLKQPQLLF